MSEDSINTQMAVLNNDIRYIKESMKTISADLKEMKGAYVPYVAFMEAKQEAQRQQEAFVKKEEFESVQSRVRAIWSGLIAIITLILLTIIGALLSLVIKQ